MQNSVMEDLSLPSVSESSPYPLLAHGHFLLSKRPPSPDMVTPISNFPSRHVVDSPVALISRDSPASNSPFTRFSTMSQFESRQVPKRIESDRSTSSSVRVPQQSRKTVLEGRPEREQFVWRRRGRTVAANLAMVKARTRDKIPLVMKDMSFLDCVVEIMSGTEVFKRNHLLSASNARVWLSSDMCEVRYKIERKGAPSTTHTLKLNDVRSLVHMERNLHIAIHSEKRAVSFIFPTLRRAEVWLCALACLVPGVADVSSCNRMIRHRHVYNVLVDSYLGKLVSSMECLGSYIILEKIAQGSSDMIQLALNGSNNTFYALKAISKRQLSRDNWRVPFVRTPKLCWVRPDEVNEVKIMSGLKHPNIVEMEAVLDDPGRLFFYIVLEYVPKRPILDINGKNVASSNAFSSATPLSEGRVRQVCVDVVRGLHYLHSRRIVHGDIKLDNLLVAADDTIKICDFGSARLCEDCAEDGSEYFSRPAVQGSLDFSAPELHQDIPTNAYASDIWSLGVILFVLLYGHTPFRARTNLEMYHNITIQPLLFPPAPLVSTPCQTLLERILEKDPEKRATIGEIANSVWLQEDSVLSEKLREVTDCLGVGKENNAPQDMISTKMATGNGSLRRSTRVGLGRRERGSIVQR